MANSMKDLQKAVLPVTIQGAQPQSLIKEWRE